MFKHLLALVALIFLATGANASWREARSKHFTVYGNVGEKQLRDFTIKLEKYDSVLRLLWDVPEGADANPLTVFLVPNQEAVRKLASEGMGFAAGFYQAGPGGSYVVAARDVGGFGSQFDLEADTLLYHEYAHHFMMQFFPSAYPPWYVEGFAELISTVDYDRNGHAMVGRAAMHRLPGLTLVKQLPMDRIVSGGIAGLKKEEIDSFYGRSWLLTHYLMMGKTRKGELQAYLAAIRGGKSFAEATKLFGDLKVLDKEITSYFKKGAYPYLLLRVSIPTPDSVAIRDLRPAETALAVERLQYVGGIAPATADQYAAKVEAVAKQFPADPFPLLLLTAARFSVQDYKGAEKAADALLAIEPGNSRALLHKGMARVRLVGEMTDAKPSDWKEARTWIAKANRADGNDPLAYAEYFNSFIEEGQRPPALALEGLGRAQELAPQDLGLRMNLAVQLAFVGRYDEAVEMIRPLAFSPHDNSFVRTAHAYLAAFEQKKMPDFQAIQVKAEEEPGTATDSAPSGSRSVSPAS